MNESKHWYAVYTKPRWEKKICAQLEKKGLVYYCPMNKVRRKWSDRYKIIEEPLFKSYVFVQVSEEEKTRVRLTDGVVNFLYWNGKPGIIKDEEIEIMKNWLKPIYDQAKNVEILRIGDTIEINKGPISTQKSYLKDITKSKYILVLESLGYILRISNKEEFTQ